MAFEVFPYTNFHDLNLDWILQIVQNAQKVLKDYESLIVNEEGSGVDVVMSQKATTDSLNSIRTSIDILSGFSTGIVYSVNTTSNTTTCNVPYSTAVSLSNKINNRAIANINNSNMVLKRQTTDSPLTWVCSSANDSSFNMFYIVHYANDNIEYLPYNKNIAQTTGNSTTDIMSQNAVTNELSEKVNTSDIVQTTGSSESLIMSQKAVTEQLSERGILQTYDNGSKLTGNQTFTITDMVPGTNATIIIDCTQNIILHSTTATANGINVPLSFVGNLTVNGTFEVSASTTQFIITMPTSPATAQIKVVYSTSSQNYLTTNDILQTTGTNINKVMSQNITTSLLAQKFPFNNIVTNSYSTQEVNSALSFAHRVPVEIRFSAYPSITVTSEYQELLIPAGSRLQYSTTSNIELPSQAYRITETPNNAYWVYYSLKTNTYGYKNANEINTLISTDYIICCLKPLGNIPEPRWFTPYYYNGILYGAPEQIIRAVPYTYTSHIESPWVTDARFPTQVGFRCTVNIPGSYLTSADYSNVYAIVSSNTLKPGLVPIITEFSSTTNNLALPIRVVVDSVSNVPATNFDISAILFYSS